MLRVYGGRKILISDEDANIVERLGPIYIARGKATPAGRRKEYARACVPGMKGKKTPVHRFIMGAKPGEVVDHVNGNTLDNRRENLRRCTQRQNCQNTVPRCGRKYKGTCFSTDQKRKKPWRSYIVVNGKQISNGRFKTEKEAARAYDAAALKHFGEFARLNYPQEKAA